MTASPSVRRCLAERDCAAAAAALFPGAELVVLEGPELRPQAPFEGPLFAALAASAAAGREAAGLVGLVVPGAWLAAAEAPALVAVADHVNIPLRGPLTGRWPARLPRAFPCMSRIYQPGVIRSAGAPSLYSEDVVVAGVGDAARLTAFERRVLDEGDHLVLSDCLVPAAIVAAYYRVNLAAGVVPSGPTAQARTS